MIILLDSIIILLFNDFKFQMQSQICVSCKCMINRKWILLPVRHAYKWRESITKTLDFRICIGGQLDTNYLKMSNNCDDRMDIECSRTWILMTRGGEYTRVHTNQVTIRLLFFYSVRFLFVRADLHACAQWKVFRWI